eukprot:gnl/MRDRNA2_/MRDRNA2_235547_c0_seq1.p1 gnl/MRDRNA2_/MRDRNA2_235547_c0~~gnl/MRDRNA2_/MRDRNA2_235547_c0_seq1.p1  ORF type:complete len:161 (+),score=20.47 gnl/MRDRNA2_/MRDRNA2_235547_c0_seq1:52-534(+)
MSSAPYQNLGEPKRKAELADAGALVLRLIAASVLVHHGLDKLNNVDAFTSGVLEPYFAWLSFNNHVPLKVWTYVAAYTEIVAPLFLAIGFMARPAALMALGTMCFATTFHFESTGLQGYPLGDPPTKQYAFETSMVLGGVFFYLLMAGPGKFALRPNGFW